MRVRWYGTASVEIAHAADRILFDPFVPLKGSTVNVTIEKYDGFSDVFVTHGHFDHISDLPEVAKRNPRVVIHCTRTPFRTLAAKGVPQGNLDLITYGQEIHIGDITLHVFHGRHAVLDVTVSRLVRVLRSPAKRNLFHIARENRVCKENDETVCYQVEAGGKSIFLMGSLNMRDDAAYPTGPDLLVLTYNGWKVNFPPAVKVIERLQPKRVILTHYDATFPPLTTPVDPTPLLKRYPDLVSTVRYEEEIEV